jgi:teichuronic acid biosynthesis protein TuaE
METFKKVLIVLLVVSSALGASFLSVDVAGVNVYFFRVLVTFVLLASPILSYRYVWLREPVPSRFLLVGYIWVVWGAMSVFWSPNFTAGVEDVVAVGLGFGVGMALLVLGATDREGIEWLRRGWVGAFLVTGAIAGWEIVTGNHLPGAWVENAPDYALDRVIVISTFGNPNNYGAFLVLSFPFLLFSRERAQSLSLKLLYSLLIPVLFGLVFLTGSRSALLGALLQVSIYIFIYGGGRRIIAALLAVATSILGLIYMGISIEDLILFSKLQTVLQGSALEDGSLSKRLGLTLNGLWMVLDSFGMGVGAGGYEMVAQNSSLPFSTGELVNPHNFLIEIVAEYGILVGVTFSYIIAWFLYIFAGRTSEGKQMAARVGVLIIAGYTFAMLANSTYMQQPSNWMSICSLMCISDYLYDS